MARRFFDVDNSLWSWIGKVPEMIGLSFLWLILTLCVPISATAAAVALYDALVKNLRTDEKGLFRRFFRTYKAEFVRGLGLSFLWIGIALVLVWIYRLLLRLSAQGGSWDVYLLIFQITCLVPISTFCWLVPLQSRFYYTFGQLHKNALLFAVSYLPQTAGILVILFLGLVALWYFPPLALVAPALVTLLLSFPIEKVLRKHMPEETE